MRYFAYSAIFAIHAVLAGCAVEHAPSAKFAYDNDCLPQAIIMTEGLRDKGIEADVLGITYPAGGHAVCRYMYPKGANKLWVWDRTWKSLNVRAYKEDADSVGKAWSKQTGKPSPTSCAWIR